MIHLLIPYDNEDLRRGEYFDGCQDNLMLKLKGLDYISANLLNTQICCDFPIDFQISKLQGHSFIFIAYLHGSEDALFVAENEYVNSQNAYLFGETMFYACSCLSAEVLGKSLMTQGCKVFLGYNTTISCVSNETEPIFSHCENAFITHFLTTEKTIQECLGFMYDEYARLKVHLVNNHGVFEASVLESNLNAFEIFLKDEDYQLTKRDFWND